MRTLAFLAFVVMIAAPAQADAPGDWVLGRVEESLGRTGDAPLDAAQPATWPVYRFDVWQVARADRLKKRFTGLIDVACYGPDPGAASFAGQGGARPRILRAGDVVMLLLQAPPKGGETFSLATSGPVVFQLPDEMPREELIQAELEDTLGIGLFYIETDLAESLALVARHLSDRKSETLDTMLINLSITPQPSMEIAALAVRTLRKDAEAREDFLNRLAVDKLVTAGEESRTLYNGEPAAPFMGDEGFLVTVIGQALAECRTDPRAAVIAQDASAPDWLRAAAAP